MRETQTEPLEDQGVMRSDGNDVEPPAETASLPEDGAAQEPTDTAPLAEEAEADGMARALQAIQEVSSTLAGLREAFDSKLRYDGSKERIIDTLHQELQSYREGLHFQILRPLFLDLIAMHDDISSLLAHATNSQNGRDESDAGTRERRNLESFRETIEETLSRYGVLVYSEDGDEFVANRQRSIKIIPTAEPDKNRLVAEKRRKGFEYEGKVLRPELVATFKLITNQA